MERHFEEELKNLKNLLLKMGFRVDSTIDKAVDALMERSRNLAEQVLEEEKFINALEIEIDDKAHSLSALMQPFAGDFRMVAAVLKINTDLERIGDHAVNIAERALMLLEEKPFQIQFPLPELTKAVQKVLSEALNAFINQDADLANRVLLKDDEIDGYNDILYKQIGKLMEDDPSFVKIGMNLVMVGHNLERIADLANNIAEGVVYLKQGKEVRHHHIEPNPAG